MTRTYVLWAIKRGRRLRIGASDARYSPLPFGARAITLVEGGDLCLMMEWCRKCARENWSVERMRAACEVP